MQECAGTARLRSCWALQSTRTAWTPGLQVRTLSSMGLSSGLSTLTQDSTAMQLFQSLPCLRTAQVGAHVGVCRRVHPGRAAGRQAAVPGHVHHEPAGPHPGAHRCAVHAHARSGWQRKHQHVTWRRASLKGIEHARTPCYTSSSSSPSYYAWHISPLDFMEDFSSRWACIWVGEGIWMGLLHPCKPPNRSLDPERACARQGGRARRTWMRCARRLRRRCWTRCPAGAPWSCTSSFLRPGAGCQHWASELEHTHNKQPTAGLTWPHERRNADMV